MRATAEMSVFLPTALTYGESGTPKYVVSQPGPVLPATRSTPSCVTLARYSLTLWKGLSFALESMTAWAVGMGMRRSCSASSQATSFVASSSVRGRSAHVDPVCHGGALSQAGSSRSSS